MKYVDTMSYPCPYPNDRKILLYFPPPLIKSYKIKNFIIIVKICEKNKTHPRRVQIK